MLASAPDSATLALKGGQGPRSLALAIVLGTVAGFVSGWNLSLAAVLLAFVVLNVRAKTFACAWMVGAIASWLGREITASLGRLLLDDTPLGSALGALGDGAWIAMFDWDRYALAGGACLALVVSLPVAKLASALARRTASGEAGESREPWVRPWGYLGGLVGLAVFAAAPWWLGPKLVEREMLRQLAAVNGAAVEAAAVRLSLWSGELEIDDLQLVDPARGDRDRLRIGRVSARLQPGSLVRGRLKTDKLLLSQLRTDVARRQTASKTQSVAGKLESRMDFQSVTGKLESRMDFQSVTANLDGPEVRPTSTEVELNGYLRNWPAFRDQLAWLGRLVVGVEQLASCEAPPSASGGSSSRGRSDLRRPQPRVHVVQLRADDLPYAWGLGRNGKLEIAQLSSNPGLAKSVARLEITAPAFSTEISAELDSQQPGGRNTLRCTAYELQLADLTEPSPPDQALVVSEGRIELQGEGWLSRDGLELNLHAEARPLDVRVASHARLAGLEAETWDQGLHRLGGLHVEAKLAGPWSAPVLSFDRQRLVEQFKHQLRAAGEHQLVSAIDERLAHPNAAESTSEKLAANPESPDEEFCTITDDAQTASENATSDGWRRAAEAKTLAGKIASPQTSEQPYPKTNSPDFDPADRLLAKLSKGAKPAADAATDEDATREYRRVERTQYTQAKPVERSQRPQAATAIDEQSLPGPINLVVGNNDPSPSALSAPEPSAYARRTYASSASERPTDDASMGTEAERDAWTEAELAAEDYPPRQPRRPTLWNRMTSGVQGTFRRVWPARRATVEPELPPDLEPSDFGPEEPIDEALERRPAVRKSLLERWWK